MRLETDFSHAKRSIGRYAEQERFLFRTISVYASQISLLKGGGTICGTWERFAANAVTGTASLALPIYVSLGSSGFAPELNLADDSGKAKAPSPLVGRWCCDLELCQSNADGSLLRGLPFVLRFFGEYFLGRFEKAFRILLGNARGKLTLGSSQSRFRSARKEERG